MATRKSPSAVASSPAPTISIGDLTDSLFALRENIAVKNKELEKLDEEKKILEEKLMEALMAQGVDGAKGKRASVSISHVVTANVTDWDSFYVFIAKKKYWHLLQRRPSDPGVRELFDKGVKVPGVEPFTKTKLNFRSV